MDSTYEQEMTRLWSVIGDLSEQLNQHRTQTASLHAQAGGIKVQSYMNILSLVFSSSPTSVVPGDPFPDRFRHTPVRDSFDLHTIESPQLTNLHQF